MARGAAEQQNLENTTAAGYRTAGQPLFGAASGAVQNNIKNPGFDPVTAAGIRRSGMDTANTAFDAAKNSAAQRAGATGNDAMFYASADKLAQDKAAADAAAATNAEVTIGKQKLDSQQQAIQDASQLYGLNTTAATAATGQANQSMEARPSALQDIEGIGNMLLSPLRITHAV
jgi:hypothetical protein